MFWKKFFSAKAVISGLAALLLTSVSTSAAQGWYGGWDWGYRGGWPGYSYAYYPNYYSWGLGWDYSPWYWGGPTVSYYPSYYYGFYPTYYYGFYPTNYFNYYPSYYGYVPSSYVSATAASGTTQSLYYSPAQAPDAGNAAHVHLRVPADATVWLDGQQMNQTGVERSFVSPALTPGKSYSYEVKARWVGNGKPVEMTRSVSVVAGKSSLLDFTIPAP